MEPELEFYDGPLPIFPLPFFTLLPGAPMGLHVFEPRYLKLLEHAVEDRKLIGLSHFRRGWEGTYFGTPRLRRIGCAGKIVEVERLPDGRANVVLLGLRKYEILEELPSEPFRTARVGWIVDRHEDAVGPKARAAVDRLFELLAEASAVREEDPPPREAADERLPFYARVNRLTLLARISPEEFVKLLETKDVYARARGVETILVGRRRARRTLEIARRIAPPDVRVN